MMGEIQEKSPASYRRAMAVTERVTYRDHSSYFLCPRCHIPLAREFMAYCDRCGQKLSWRHCRRICK